MANVSSIACPTQKPTSKQPRVLATLALLAALCVFVAIGLACLASSHALAADDAQPQKATATGTGPDINALTGSNWMSAISDERLLSEINIPGTHDSAMANSVAKYPWEIMTYLYAETQYKEDDDKKGQKKMYIEGQLEHGIRLLDLRITNEPCLKSWDPTNDQVFLCHGPEKFCYYAKDGNGKGVRLATVLSQIEKFLEHHRTETVLVSIGYESGSGDENETYRRARAILDKHAAALYRDIQNRADEKFITHMPKLADARGKIVILSKNAQALGYGMQLSTGNEMSSTTLCGMKYYYENHWEATKDEKLKHVNTYFGWNWTDSRDPSKTFMLPTRADKHLDFGGVVCTTSNRPPFVNALPLAAPLGVAETVNPVIYGDADHKSPTFAQRGKFFGWVHSDFVTPAGIRTLYLSNFPDTLKYAKVTYTSKAHPDKKPSDEMLVGSTLTLPASKTYFKSGVTRSIGFSGWRIGDKLYQPGEKVVIEADTTIEATWGETLESINDRMHINPHVNAEGEIEVKLETGDVVAADFNAPIIVYSNTKVKLDLNGHTIDFNAEGTKKHGVGTGVLVMGGGQLTVVGKGAFKGAKGTAGGAFRVLGTLILDGDISVTGNKAETGGGISVGPEGEVVVRGNTNISANEAASGGGVHVCGGGSLKLEGAAKIAGNTALNGGGAYLESRSAFEMAGGSVTGNVAGKLNGKEQAGCGGGVFVQKGAEVDNASVSVSGTARVSDNTAIQAVGDKRLAHPSNVYLMDSTLVRVAGGLSGTGSIGVSSATTPTAERSVTITSGLSSHKESLRAFASDHAQGVGVQLGEAGEAVLSASHTVTFDYRGGHRASAGESTAIVKPGEKLAKPADPEKSFSTFAGWYTDEGCTNAYNFDDVVTKSFTLYAKWAEAKCTVTFDAAGGSPVANQTLSSGEMATKPANPTRTGYDFKYWECKTLVAEAGLKEIWGWVEYKFDKPVTRNLEVRAAWTPRKCVVSFDTDGAGEVTSQTVDYGTTATKPTDPAKDSYVFAGWYLVSGSELSSQPFDFARPVKAESVALRARWQKRSGDAQVFAVSFDTRGALSPIAAQEVRAGQKATRPEDPVKPGHTFGGWSADPSGEGAEFDFGQAISKDTVLYAKWTAETFDVTFETGGGSAVDAQKRAFGQTATRPASSPTKEGFVFGGWYEPVQDELTDEEIAAMSGDPEFNEILWIEGREARALYDFDTPIVGKTTLHARWLPATPTVTFDSQGGSAVQSQPISYNSSASEPTPPSKAQYTFAGWFRDKACTQPFPFSTPITHDMTLYARWSPATCIVTFNSGNGTAIEPQQVEPGAKAVRPDNPTRDGSTFAGWYTDASTTTAYNFDAPVASSFTLYAKWESPECTVSFAAAGGTPAPAAQTVEYGKTASAPADPQREGCDFEGWYTEAGYASQFDFATPITRDLTLYAKWKRNAYDVTFETAGAQPTPAKQTVEHGSCAQEPQNPPVKTGKASDGSTDKAYLFVGWYEELELSAEDALTDEERAEIENDLELDSRVWVIDATHVRVEYDFNTPVEQDTTLYARWVPESCTVVFDDAGDSVVEPQVVGYNGYASEPEELPERDGAAFDAWYAEGSEEPFDFDNTCIKDDLTLHAKWLEAWTATFVDEAGEIFEEQLVEKGANIVAPEGEVEGKVFGGWYADAQLTKPFDFSAPLTQSVTIYGQWSDALRTVTFDSDGGNLAAPKAARVAHGQKVANPAKPTRQGYEFMGWYQDVTSMLSPTELRTMTYDENNAVSSDFKNMFWVDGAKTMMKFDLSTSPIYEDVVLHARWGKAPQADNPLKVKGKTIRLKAGKLAKKAQKLKVKKAFKIAGNMSGGKIAFKKLKGSAKVKVKRSGRVVVKRGLKRGTYKIKVQVVQQAAGAYPGKTIKATTLKIKVA